MNELEVEPRVRNRKTKIAAIILLVFIFLLAISFFATLSHARTTVRKSNGMGTVVEYSNPNTYLFGNIVSGGIMGSEDEPFTHVLFQPSHAMLLYTENVLFCGDQSKAFNGLPKSRPILVTYRTVATRMYQGVACHNLVSVDVVVAKDKQ